MIGADPVTSCIPSKRLALHRFSSTRDDAFAAALVTDLSQRCRKSPVLDDMWQWLDSQWMLTL